MSGNYPAGVIDNDPHFDLPSGDSDFRCEAQEDTRCARIAREVWRECYTPLSIAVLLCNEHAGGARAMGYRFDEEATVQLCRDVEREQEFEASLR